MKFMKIHLYPKCVITLFMCLGFLCTSCDNKNDVTRRVKDIIDSMNIDQKIGQLIMPDLRIYEEDGISKNVTVLNDDLYDAIGNYHFGGIDLFLENCENTSQLVKLTYDMQKAATDDGLLPLIIAIDQEGGNVTRAKFGTALSGNMAIGASGDVNIAYQAGEIIGKELNALGINCNFGPVLDVNKNEKNPIIGVRSFSGEVEVVNKMGVAIANGLNKGGVLNCLKHFPGHGDTSTDSHTGLPLVNESYEEWIKNDGAPFEKVIKENKADLIMTAHIQYPGLDDTLVYSSKTQKDIVVPATMSKRILTNILKETFGFKGVVITDAMNMGAISQQFEPNEAVIKALEAGADMILMPFDIRCINDFNKLDSLYADIKEAINTNKLSNERINDALTRIITLKVNKGIIDNTNKKSLDALTTNALSVVGCKDHRDKERVIANKCVNVKCDKPFSNFDVKTNDNVVCLMPREKETYSVEHSLLRMMKEHTIPNINYKCINYESMWTKGEEISQEIIDAVNNADYLILGFFQDVNSLDHPEYIRNIVFNKLLGLTKTPNIGILWEYLPYGVDAYSKDYPCALLYNSVGMLKEDIGKDLYTGVYGPAIPAGMEALF